MLSTSVFNENLDKPTAYGKFVLKGHGDTAEITFTDLESNTTRATIRAYTLNDLKKTSLFADSLEEKSEVLISTWNTRTYENAIIKFSGKSQLAFTLRSEGNPDNDLMKLCHEITNPEADYFREARFFDFLAIQKMTIEKFRAIPGMSEAHIKLLSSHVLILPGIINNGFTFEDMGRANIRVLKRVLDKADSLQGALLFLTKQQILGLDHSPLPVDAIKEALPEADNGSRPPFFSGRTSDSDGKFSYSYKQNKSLNAELLNPDDEKKPFLFQLTFESVQPDEAKKLNDMQYSRGPDLADNRITLVNDWYQLVHSSDYRTGMHKEVLFSPELNIVMTKIFNDRFPVEKFMAQHGNKLLANAPFYNEIPFKAYIDRHKLPLGELLNKLQKFPDISKNKSDIIARNARSVYVLLGRGIELADLSQVEDDRLELILKNLHLACNAFDFMGDARELFGLKPKSALSFLSRKADTVMFKQDPMPDADNANPPREEVRKTWVFDKCSVQ